MNDVTEEMKKRLKALLGRGVLTPQEYEAARPKAARKRKRKRKS